MNLVNINEVRDEAAQIIPFAAGAVPAEDGEYPRGEDVAGGGNEAGLGVSWLLFQPGQAVTIQPHHPELAGLALIADIVDGDQGVVAIIGGNKLREVELEVVVAGDDQQVLAYMLGGNPEVERADRPPFSACRSRLPLRRALSLYPPPAATGGNQAQT